MKQQSLWTRGAAALALVMSLGACAPLMVGGMVGGAMVASDRRTSGIQLEDEGIELRGGNRIREMLGSRVHINLTSYNRQVLLTGEVPTQKDKDLIAQDLCSLALLPAEQKRVLTLLKSDAPALAKQMRFLQQRGFSRAAIQSVLRRAKQRDDDIGE
mgnify:CR=1 FL=1